MPIHRNEMNILRNNDYEEKEASGKEFEDM